jgi:hypothetical protein
MATAACGGASGSTPSTFEGVTAIATSSAYQCPSAQTSSGPLNCTSLPLGDRRFTTAGPAQGDVYTCQSLSGVEHDANAPWMDAANGTWSLPGKAVVAGAVSWAGNYSQTVSAGTRTISSDGVPVAPYTTGTFPISPSDPAYQYDGNPNAIGEDAISLSLPANPTAAAQPSCVSMGLIGVTVTGVAIYNAFDAAGYDAVAHEEQDGCHGHPDQSEQYHYHGILQACVPDAGSTTQNSSLLGYALDGYGIYGPWYDGKVLTSADLDECHGTTSVVDWDGKQVSMYHYVSTYDFPYTVACFRGTPISTH